MDDREDPNPPPPYSAAVNPTQPPAWDPDPATTSTPGHIVNAGLGTNARVSSDGRVDIRIGPSQDGSDGAPVAAPGARGRLAALLEPVMQWQRDQQLAKPPPTAGAPPATAPPTMPGEGAAAAPPPSMNVVVMIVGSRGDVQPFVAFGQALRDGPARHRVRIATHGVFKALVEDAGLEFFGIGGDPAELMAFMVKNPGLMPGFDTLRSGEVGKRRRAVEGMLRGCWRACFEAGDGSGPAVGDGTVGEWMVGEEAERAGEAARARPFVADCIVANPPSFAHLHCAEKLGVPLHIMFTMPWSATQAFPHPLANVQSSNADVSMTNYITYSLIEMLTWQGLGDVINRFRVRTLGLEPMSSIWAPGILQRLKIPHTYCWSPALIPKPADWGPHLSVAGFYFLKLASTYTPDPDLAAFLAAGPPPIYVGFGSIVVDDPNAMTKMIFEAVEKTGQRALVSKGWGGLGADEMGVPDGVFMIGNVPHDWLFTRVSCVVHHGGAGTTAAGIACGKPTVIVPFFGDQPFWGAMVAKAGAGPAPIPYKDLTADGLADAIVHALKPDSMARAQEMARKIAAEDGMARGAQSFHRALDLDQMRCQIFPDKPAVWRVRRTQIRLSALAAYTLYDRKVLTWDDLKLYRAQEYEADIGPPDPISGGATAIIETLGSSMMGVADLPVETLKVLKIYPSADKAKKSKASKNDSTSSIPLRQGSTESGNPDVKPDSSSVMSSALTHTTATSDSTVLEPSHASTASLESELSEALLDVPPRHERSPSPQMRDAVGPLSDTASETSTSGRPQTPRSRSRNSAADTAAKAAAKATPSSAAAEGKQRRSASATLAAYAPADPLDTLYGTGRGLGKIVGAGLKSPLDFTLALSRGFHNLPRLYGEQPRPVGRVTGFHSGLRTAGKEFGQGIFGGVSGLVTQPVEGARTGGAGGFLKGVGRGVAGLVVKPAAAGYALPAYAMMGVYKELQKRLGGESVGAYIIAARVAQGYGEWLEMGGGEEGRQRGEEEAVRRWGLCLADVRTHGLGAAGRGVGAVRAFVDRRAERHRGAPSTAAQTPPATAPMHSQPQPQQSGRKQAEAAEVEDAALEETIRLSLQLHEQEKTAHVEGGDAEVWRAIKASLDEMHAADQAREQEQLRAAAEAARAVGSKGNDDAVGSKEPGDGASEDHDEELRRAMEESLADEEDRRKKAHEEEVVLEYVRRQSEAEEQWRRKKEGLGGST